MKADILGLKVDNITMAGAVEKVLGFFHGEGCKMIVTPNAEMAMAAVKDRSLMEILNSSDLVIPDGAGVVLGARLLKRPVQEKVAGVDLVKNLLASGKEFSVFLYGSAPGVAEKAAQNITSAYPSVSICGTEHGYHDASENSAVLGRINEAEPDFLLVALGVPAQEKWISENQSSLRAKAAIGCGGTIDILSGNIKRAPVWMIKLNLEWLHRLILQPKRFVRMLRIPVFLFKCLVRRFKNSSK